MLMILDLLGFILLISCASLQALVLGKIHCAFLKLLLINGIMFDFEE